MRFRPIALACWVAMLGALAGAQCGCEALDKALIENVGELPPEPRLRLFLDGGAL